MTNQTTENIVITEQIQLGDYESCRKTTCIFILICISICALLLLNTTAAWAYITVLIIVAALIFGTLLLTKGRLRERFNCTGRIRYEADKVWIHIRNTTYIVNYNEIKKIDYYPRRRIQKGKDNPIEFVNRYEVLITTSDNKTLRLSTPFGKYYSDLLYSGLYRLITTCKQHMTTEHTQNAAAESKPYDESNDYTYHKIVYPGKHDDILIARKDPAGQTLTFDNFEMHLERDDISLVSDSNIVWNEKYTALIGMYLFEKYTIKAGINKHLTLRMLYKNYKYKDFVIADYPVDAVLTKKDCEKACKVITAANAFIERANL